VVTGTTARAAGQRPAAPFGRRGENMAALLGLLRTDGPWSRTRLAEMSGLSRATVASVVDDLASRGLVVLGDRRADGSPGRPGQSVALDGQRLWGLGLQVGGRHVAAVALDLSGRTVFDRRTAIPEGADNWRGVVEHLAGSVEAARESADEHGAQLLGARIAVPGLVDAAHDLVVTAPNLGWQNLAVADEVTGLLSGPLPVRVANDANLTAVAEHAYGTVAGTPDLVVLTGELGVGAGIVVQGRPLGGAEGYAGEVGHVQIDPAGRDCACGRRGCWETMVGFRAVLQVAATGDDPVRDPAVDVEVRVDDIARRAAEGDTRTLHALHAVGVDLGRGAAWLVNVFNPGALVLAGYFAPLAPYLIEAMRAEMAPRILVPGLGGCRVVQSALGFTAAARGGAHLALSSVFADPTWVEVSSGGAR
jgi:predicted NBD/HSP70 family sugar kinase